MTKLYSFDVYDTLITRLISCPSDLFYFVGKKISVEYHIRPIQYMYARMGAERRARLSSKPKDDCSFDKIFDEFCELREWGIPKKIPMDLELDFECKASRPIVANVAKVKELVNSGKKVIFVSDMYLPRDFIWDLLCKYVISCPREDVFVSGDLGIAKYTGRLFEYILNARSIKPHELEHFGDNFHSDVKVPRRLGIKATIYTDIQPTHYGEGLNKSNDASFFVSGANGVARVTRLMSYNLISKEKALVRIVSNIIAPMLTAYVSWVLHNARQQSIQRLYFVSRDGQIFYKVASKIRTNDDPECYYIYGSRQAWFLPSVIEIKECELDWAWTAGMSRRGIDILRRLDIDTPETRNILAQEGFDEDRLLHKLDDNDFNLFRKLLLDKPLAGLIMRRVIYHRSLAEKYFRQEGLLEEGSWALVDVGWTLKSQLSLKKILSAVSNTKVNVQGYYFGIVNNHVPLEQAGSCYAFVSQPDSDLETPLVAKWFFKLSTILLIEHLFTVADHQTMFAYQQVGDRIVPVFKDENRSKDVIIFASKIHEIVLRYAFEIRMSQFIDEESHEFCQHAFSVMEKFCMAPEKADVLGVSWLPTNKDQSHEQEHMSHLASPLRLTDLWLMVKYDMFPRHEAFFTSKSAWHEGSIAISGCVIRFVYYLLIRLRKIRNFFNSRD